MGDAAGVGPELCLQVLAGDCLPKDCLPVIYGSYELLQIVAQTTGIRFDAPALHPGDWDGGIAGEKGFVVDCGGLDAKSIAAGRVQADCGAASFLYIKAAVADALAGRLAGIATAPINKESLSMAGVPYPGHTEMLADLTNTDDYCMMMLSPEITVCLVTTHIALRDVSCAVSQERIYKVIELADAALRQDGRRPRLTVCALNPHAGENGLFGDEEQTLIMPAVEHARRNGFNVYGPLSPDTAFMPAIRERTDGYIVMYHDQGLIPFKMLAFDHGINVTLGLPIVRSSPDHGTAFDIARQGRADPCSMFEAVRYAAGIR